MNDNAMSLLRKLAEGEEPRLRLMAEVLAEVGLIANTPQAKATWSGYGEFRPPFPPPLRGKKNG